MWMLLRRHWAKIDDHVQAPMARVVGGLDSEVCIVTRQRCLCSVGETPHRHCFA